MGPLGAIAELRSFYRYTKTGVLRYEAWYSLELMKLGSLAPLQSRGLAAGRYPARQPSIISANTLPRTATPSRCFMSKINSSCLPANSSASLMHAANGGFGNAATRIERDMVSGGYAYGPYPEIEDPFLREAGWSKPRKRQALPRHIPK